MSAVSLTVYVLCLVAQSCLTLCDPVDCSPPGSSVQGDSPGKNTGVGSLSILQGIFLIQGSNLGLLHYRWILYQLSHKGSPRILEWVPYPSPEDLPDPGIEPRSLELQIGSKLGKEYIKAVYYHPAYLTYMQSISCEMPGWMK